MSYGLIYTVPFSSSLGKSYVVEIEKENYSGESVEIVADESPFVVNCEGDDFIYTPIRTSTASLKIFGSDYLQELYSTEYRQYRVILKELADNSNKILWSGFVKPEVYTQEYGDEDFTLSIECVSAIEVLDKIDYENENRNFVSLWDLVKYCISESRGIYEYIYMPFVYLRSKDESSTHINILSYLKVSAQNFFDEDDAPMTCKEILEEICKVMNWTLVDFGGSLYFIDPDNLNGKYLRAVSGSETWEKVSIEYKNVQDIGYDGENHTLDILGGYNKVTIKCSNYPVGDALPDLSFDEMEKIAEFTNNAGSNQKAFYRVRRGTKFETDAYIRNSGNGALTSIGIEDEKKLDFSSGLPSGLVGCIPLQEDIYEVDSNGNPLIADYEFTNYMNIPTESNGEIIYLKDNTTRLIGIKGATSSYADGAFNINFNVVFGAYIDRISLSSYDFHFQLRIGNKYYHGKSDGSFRWDENSGTDSEYDNNLEIKWGDGTTDINIVDKTLSLNSSRKLGDGLNGVKGYICKIPDGEVLSGDLELKIFGPCIKWNYNGQEISFPIKLSDMEFTFNKYEDSENEESDSDRIYENVINESYVNELDEIELKISTYNKDGACFSKLVIENKYLEDNLYCLLVNKNVRLEELLIQRIVSYYKKPHIKLTQQLCYEVINPAGKLTDDSQPDKSFMYVGGEIDYQQDTMSVIMIEKE